MHLPRADGRDVLRGSRREARLCTKGRARSRDGRGVGKCDHNSNNSNNDNNNNIEAAAVACQKHASDRLLPMHNIIATAL